MARMTLLELTQDILSEMDSDEVNSISDTVEAFQVANTIRTTYFNIIDGKDWPWLKELFKLTALGDVARPSHMQLPTDIINVLWVKYNTRVATATRDRFQTIKYKTPTEFMVISESRDSSATTITKVTDFSGTSLNIKNDVAPTYYTSFDENYIVFDSYDSAVDSTVQESKTQCYGKRYPTFTLADSFYPDLPVQMFSYLLNEAKSVCFLLYKQMPNQKAEQHSISQRRRMSQEAWRIKNGITYPDYGRK